MPETNEKELQRLTDVTEGLFERWREKQDKSERTFKFAKGDGWDKDLIAELDKAKLPHLSLNIMLPIFLRIFGAERNGRGNLKAVPMRDGDIQTAATQTKLLEWADTINHMQDQFGMAFKQSIVGDLGGWVRCHWGYQHDPLGSPIVEWLNSFYVYPGEGERTDLRDCQHIAVSFFQPREILEAKFPDKSAEIKKKLTEDKKSLVNRVWDSTSRLFGTQRARALDGQLERSGEFRVTELYERKTELEFVGEVETVEGRRLARFLDANDPRIPEGVELRARQKPVITVTTFVNELMILQESTPLPVQIGMFPLFPVWGMNLDGENIGLGRQLEDSMDEYQKSRSAELHMIGTSANSGWQYEEGQIDDEMEKTLEESGGAMGLLLRRKPGTLPLEKIKPNAVPTALVNRSREAKDDMQFISSVGDNSLGRSESRNESGKLFDARVEEFMSTLAEFFANLTSAQEACGTYLMAMMQAFMRQERTLQVVGQNGDVSQFTINEVLPLSGETINRIDRGTYIAKVEKGANTTTTRREVVNLLLQTLQYAPDEVAPAIVRAIFKKLELLDEETRAEIVQALDALIPPSAAEQLEAELNAARSGLSGAAQVNESVVA
jgi:hypothetical protein